MAVSNSCCENVSNKLIAIDLIMDYIPIISIVNNVVDIVAKIALGSLSIVFSKFYKSIEENHYVSHLNQKSIITCVFLTIPVINFFVALIHQNIATNSNNGQPISKPQIKSLDDMLQKLKEDNNKFLKDYERKREKDRLKIKQDIDNSVDEYQKKIAELEREIATLPDGPVRTQKKEMISKFEDLVKSYKTNMKEIAKSIAGIDLDK